MLMLSGVQACISFLCQLKNRQVRSITKNLEDSWQSHHVIPESPVVGILV